MSQPVSLLAREFPGDYARFHVLLDRLLDLNSPLAPMQEEIALVTGEVFPQWQLAEIRKEQMVSTQPRSNRVKSKVMSSGSGRGQCEYKASISHCRRAARFA